MALMTDVERSKYWTVVYLCLVHLHGMQPKQALQKIQLRMIKLKNAQAAYHALPFDVACTLAGKELSYEKNFAQYEKLMAQALDAPPLE